MDLQRKTYKTELYGEPIEIEISRLAHQANASILGRYGDTVVLTTAVMSADDKNMDYFPLIVDYSERYYAAGRILGSRFIRREGRPSDEAILSARLIDRAIRPLFDHRLRREVQITVTILAYDEKHDPDVIALLTSSLALSISDIPWQGPVAGIGIQRSETADGTNGFSGFFAGPRDRINMIEFEGKDVPEDVLAEIFDEAQSRINELVNFQEKIITEHGRKKADIFFPEAESELKNRVKSFLKSELASAVANKGLMELKSALLEKLRSEGETGEVLQQASDIFEHETNAFVHEEILKRERRPDGRKLNELRDLYGEVGLFARTHGSGLFIRGDTQLLAVTTLAPPGAEQLVETMEELGKKRFMLHYNFPGFSVGEVSRPRGPGRREIGHGALAAKAIRAYLPDKDDFPYTIRVVAETLSSNGSSSMATVCATSLSLMDAGVPLSKHVAGIAIGLAIDEKTGDYKILTDIQGPEDHYLDMDFKVAGTRDGVSAIQLDMKIRGMTKNIFRDALAAGRDARFRILDVLESVLPSSRPELSPYAPRVAVVEIEPEQIGLVVGPGGKIINGIIADAGGDITIDIEQTGKIYVSGTDPKLVEQAVKTIREITKEYKVGELVQGKVVRIMDFGAIVDLGGGRDGMVHVSELKDGYVKKVEDVVKLGDEVWAKVIRVEDGRIALSMRGIRNRG